MELAFSLKDLSYYREREKVVEVYHSTSTSFYYLRQDVLEEILERFDVHLDFEMYAEKTSLKKSVGGEGRYKEFSKISTYKEE